MAKTVKGFYSLIATKRLNLTTQVRTTTIAVYQNDTTPIIFGVAENLKSLLDAWQ